ncbi:MAG: Phosphocholine transferase AnkX [Chlamydiae bacterium]|nr:Phosphocholine transferase AnkX [Chlamydiota bacterium]
MRKTISVFFFAIFVLITCQVSCLEVSKITPSEMKLITVSESQNAPEDLVQALQAYHESREFKQTVHEFLQFPHHYFDQRVSALESLQKAIPDTEEWMELRHQAECKLAYLNALPDVMDDRATQPELHDQGIVPMSAHMNDSYWFEYLDPLHRIGPEVKVHIDTWLASDIPNYFIYLETVEYDPLLNQFAPFENQVEYFLTDQERVEHRLNFENGMCYLNDLPFDTGESFSLHSDEPGLAIFTVGLDGEVYVNSHIKYKIHHSSEFAGGEVISAGELKAEDGIIKELSNKSGHYSPKHREVMLMLEVFYQKLGDLTGIDLVMFQYTKTGQKYFKQYATFDSQAYLETNGITQALRATGEWTPLHVSVWNDHIDLIPEVLIPEFLEAHDFQGNTPLHLAVSQGHLEWIYNLLEAGANPIAQNHLGETPLHLACMNGDENIVKILLKKMDYVDIRNDKEQTPLHYAAKSGSFPIYQALIQKGANIDAFDEDGNHLLHFAVYENNSQFIQKLLESDLISKLHQPNRKNATVLHSAAAFGDQQVLQLILGYDFDLNQTDYKGRTPLHYAAKFGNEETTSFLIHLNDPKLLHAKNHRSLTAFHYAAQHLPLSSIKEFLQAGVKVNAVDYKGRSAIYYAITGRCVNSLRNLKYLLCHGAYTHIYNTKGQAPIHYATARGSVSSVRRLLSSSNDLEIKDSQGRTPLDIAKSKDYQIMTKYLTEHSN